MIRDKLMTISWYYFPPAKCSELPKPAHGSLSTSDTTVDTTVSTVCDSGSHFDSTTGDSAVVCRSDQSWSSTLGVCKEGD